MPTEFLVFIDCETTGLTPWYHEVIDIWATRTTKDLEVITESGGLVAPLHIENADPKALQINGFDQEVWNNLSVPWSRVWEDVQPVIDGAMIVGHNPSFDIRFIEAMCFRHGTKMIKSKYSIDTVTLVYPLQQLGLIKSVSLDSLCEFFGVDDNIGQAHSALGDVHRTIEVYRQLMHGLKWVG